MANYDNIKPYADFAHEAAQHGGVEKYLDEIAQANKKLGVLEERDSEGWKGALLLGAGLLLWEGGKAGVRKYKEHKKKKKAEQEALAIKSDNAKKAIVQGVKEARITEEIENNKEKED